ncbi:MAG: hypothetical protein ACI4PK_02080 [Oscillospiraceae bacterium]
MKKRVFLAAILNLAMCYSSTYAFDGSTHTYVTVKTLETFEKAHGTKYNEIFTPENKAIIVEYCVMPDKDETEDTYSQHFFNLMAQKTLKATVIQHRQSYVHIFTELLISIGLAM